ncbi:hypothetical protein B0T10DRAFT_567863 [Thelonectria olida]|uniref:Uncharacterized protein n=1 Tax=Thelonectria olida TaxID=1576542 RepID=A0A9P9AKV7_9HYPO|nr:hypothetical protein B0T10DRAFT_567863 [Thelonectria olida]
MSEEQRYSTILSDFLAGRDHSARTAAILKLTPDQVQALDWNEGLLIAGLKAISIGAMFITGEHRDKLQGMSSKEQCRYISNNLPALRQAEKEFLNSGLSIAHNRFLVWQDALRSDKPVEEVANATEPTFLDQYTKTVSWWRRLDCGSLPLWYLRDFWGGNMMIDRPETVVIVAKDDVEMWKKVYKSWTVNDLIAAAYRNELLMSKTELPSVTVQGWWLNALGDSICPGTIPGRQTISWLAGVTDKQLFSTRRLAEQMLALRFQSESAEAACNPMNAPTQFARTCGSSSKRTLIEQVIEVDVVGKPTADDGIVDAHIRYPTVEAAVRGISLEGCLRLIKEEHNEVESTKAQATQMRDKIAQERDAVEIERLEKELEKIKEREKRLEETKATYEDLQRMHEDKDYREEKQKQGRKEIDRAKERIIKPGKH